MRLDPTQDVLGKYLSKLDVLDDYETLASCRQVDL